MDVPDVDEARTARVSALIKLTTKLAGGLFLVNDAAPHHSKKGEARVRVFIHSLIRRFDLGDTKISPESP